MHTVDIVINGNNYTLLSFRWLGVIIYWLLLFTVVVILLNILIAQFSHSYEEQRQRAQHSVTLTRARLIDRMETLFWAKRMLQVRVTYYYK